MGKLPLSFFSLATKTGEGDAARRRRPGRWPWARWRSRGGGKGRGSHCGSIPPLNLGGGGIWRRSHGGGRQTALVFMVAALRGSTAAGVRGEREREVRRSYSPPYIEKRRCKEAAPRWLARGGGYGSGWRRWGAGEGVSGGGEVRGGEGRRGWSLL